MEQIPSAASKSRRDGANSKCSEQIPSAESNFNSDRATFDGTSEFHRSSGSRTFFSFFHNKSTAFDYM